MVLAFLAMSLYNRSVFESSKISTVENTVVSIENNDISDETRKTVETVCFAGLITAACLLGIPANVINCLVFGRQGLKDRMNLCLFCLAFTDCFFLTCTFFIFSVSSFVRFYDETLGEEYFLKSLVSLMGVMHGCRLTSGFITMIIAVERCLCVLFPLHVAMLMSTRVMGCLLLFFSLTFQSLYIIVLFTARAVLVQKDNSSSWIITRTDFFEENKTVIQSLLNIVLGNAVPVTTFSVVSVATMTTVLKLKVSMEWRAQSSARKEDNHSRQTALTLMLVAVSCVYIFTMIPLVTWQTTEVILQDMFSPNHLYNVNMVTNAVVNSCPVVNSSVHFLVYYFRSSRFRRVFHSICCFKVSRSLEMIIKNKL